MFEPPEHLFVLEEEGVVGLLEEDELAHEAAH